jgi:hypothetical protein
LADNRASLREKGLIYPDGRGLFGNTATPHHSFAHALTGTDPMGRRKAVAFLNSACSSASPRDTILISSEPLYRHIADNDKFGYHRDYWNLRRRYLTSLSELLTGFDVSVLLFFRRRDTFAESLYGEVVQKGRWQGSFREFLSEYEPWFDYERQLELFRRILGDVHVESYEAARNAGLITTFFRSIGLPTPPGVENIWERRAANADQQLFSSPEERRAFLAKYQQTSKS